ncbi:epidermal growth factor 6 isoform X1 [Brachionus plicatilis]|uniref:Epidermal growth factor 6 isoform X1 n=1 Tax=Brachionus plicatilis TaxID=10195 RepID=A0A3M7RW64_BRAPC|nr:epidermal growth factor 6 isoform X1 [Brachionus plicatilis]
MDETAENGFKCSEGTFGNNCDQTCQCTENFVKCDSITGCICEPGFEGIDCKTEIDACEGFTNTQIQTCVSRSGERVLFCSPGYELRDDGNCTKIDYCNPNPCSDQTTCTSLDVNFTCTCQSGFEYNYETTVCDDIAECLTVQCPLNSQCIELPGSYNCRCNSGFENKNTDTKLPECVDINECEQNTFVCAPDRKCKNTIGDYECVCNDGFEEINQQCVQITTAQTTESTITSTTTSTTSTVSTAVSQDNTGLILVIVLPIIAVLILSVIAGLICFCWYRKSNGSLSSRKKVPNIVEERAGISGLNQKSMFEKKDVATEPDLINFDENAEVDRDGFEDGSSGSHSTYRPSYLFDKTDNADVFKALEENARSSQKKTIGRPQSLFTGSSFSVPTAYHETTTPYGDFAGDRNRQEQGLSENDIKYFMNDEDTFDAFDNDDDLDEIIEAFNPNVKIPRPKIQLNPLKIFKFGNKNAESEN